MRKIGRPYNSAVEVGRGQTVELARVWPAELHPPPTFRYYRYLPGCPALYIRAITFPLPRSCTWRTNHCFRPSPREIRPPLITRSRSNSFQDRSIDERPRLARKLHHFSLFSFLSSLSSSFSSFYVEEDGDDPGEGDPKIKPWSKLGTQIEKSFSVSRLEFLSQRYERTLKDVSSLLSKTRYTGSYTESELKRSGGKLLFFPAERRAKLTRSPRIPTLWNETYSNMYWRRTRVWVSLLVARDAWTGKMSGNQTELKSGNVTGEYSDVSDVNR